MNIKDIAQAGYQTVKEVGEVREAIMNMVKEASQAGNNKLVSASALTSDGISMETHGKISDLNDVDISTGAGALILDDILQELSTVEQAAAQLVAAENRAQKQIHSVTGS